MSVDVTVEAVIARPRPEVAEYCCDPDNDTSWSVNIRDVRWLTEEVGDPEPREAPPAPQVPPDAASSAARGATCSAGPG